MDLDQLNDKIAKASEPINRIREETAKVIVGQQYMIDRLLLGLLTKGHVLLEGLPGLAKTLAIKTLSETISAKFSRIQFTPDLLPADIVGTMIYNPAENDFSVRKGPVFANFVLADEINRAPAKVQSALLEAMQERQVTIGSDTYRLEEPFLVLATQNPIEQEGTYPLPEAQTDRFMLKLDIGYPSMEEEHQIVLRNLEPGFDRVSAVAKPEELLAARELVREVYLDEKVRSYIIDLVFASRNPEAYGLGDLKPLIRYGGSPRASINLAKVAKAHAFLRGRGYVTPEDVREMIMDVMRHRLGLTYEAEAEDIKAVDVVNRILNVVAVP
ncbi:MAG: MoxR family ATPase [Bacteroidota bacterium]